MITCQNKPRLKPGDRYVMLGEGKQIMKQLLYKPIS